MNHLNHSNAIRNAKDQPLSELKADCIEVPMWAWIIVIALALIVMANVDLKDDFKSGSAVEAEL